MDSSIECERLGIGSFLCRKEVLGWKIIFVFFLFVVRLTHVGEKAKPDDAPSEWMVQMRKVAASYIHVAILPMMSEEDAKVRSRNFVFAKW